MGLEYARGVWVFFLDSDDSLPSQAIESLMAHSESDVDMVLGGIRKCDDLNDDLETIAFDQEKTISIEGALDGFVVPKQWHGDWQRYLVNRIYRLSVINEFGLRFLTNIYYKEDGLFVAQYLCRCENKVVCIPDIVYSYRQTTTSAMGSLSTSYDAKLLTNIDSHGYIFRELKKRGVCKDILERELGHLFQNYDWIGSVMKQSRALTRENNCVLIRRIIKNAGPTRAFFRFVVPLYGRKIKKKLNLILR
jgi:Glycosyl transferase family 2.